MRCGCPQCGAFMIQAEDGSVCNCPDCGYQCNACLGTGTAISRADAQAICNDPRLQEMMERLLTPEPPENGGGD